MATAQDVSIVFYNNTDHEIKITKVEYQVGDGWDTENMLGIDGHQKLEPHQHIGGERNLQKVGGIKTQLKVTYRVHIGGDKYDVERYAYSADFTAQDNNPAAPVYIV